MTERSDYCLFKCLQLYNQPVFFLKKETLEISKIMLNKNRSLTEKRKRSLSRDSIDPRIGCFMEKHFRRSQDAEKIQLMRFVTIINTANIRFSVNIIRLKHAVMS